MKKILYNKKSGGKGFSIVELIVAVAILGLITLAVSTFQVNVITFNQYGADITSSAQDARSILRTMVQEMRSAKSGSNGSYAIAQAATNTVTFYSDINSDGLEDQIHYFLASTTLEKGVIAPSGSPVTYSGPERITVLAYNIKNGTSTPLFEYFDTTYSGTSSPLAQPVSTSAVRLIKINLQIDADPRRSPLPRLYTSDAMLRNLKDNL